MELVSLEGNFIKLVSDGKTLCRLDTLDSGKYRGHVCGTAQWPEFNSIDAGKAWFTATCFSFILGGS